MKTKKYTLLECFDCHKEFHSKLSNLRRHIKIHGPEVLRVKCDQCNRSFQNRSNYFNHFKNKNTFCVLDEPNYVEEAPKGLST